MDKNYYELFGISQSADVSTIKKTYRKLAMRLHPDRNPQDPNATKNFQNITEAYTILSDPYKRKQYDLQIGVVSFKPSNKSSWRSPPPKKKTPKMPDYYEVFVDEVDLIVRRHKKIRIHTHTPAGKVLYPLNLKGVKAGTEREFFVNMAEVDSIIVRFRYYSESRWRPLGYDLESQEKLKWSQLLGFSPWWIYLVEGGKFPLKFSWKDVSYKIPSHGLYKPDGTRGDLRVKIFLTFLQKVVYNLVNYVS